LTPAENRLWQAVRSRRLKGSRFRRQQPIGPFIADFYCPAAQLVVELDGGVHATQQGYDESRDEVLRANGLLVLRFPNTRVMEEMPKVLEEIASACESQLRNLTHRPPLPSGEGE
jgi:very-short-patch-repair endonuclease